MNPILEGYVKYRYGKKWKRRYCILCSPSKNLSVLHLYFGKYAEDFHAAFRVSSSSGSQTSQGAFSSLTEPVSSSSGSKTSVNVFHSLTTRSNYYCNLPHTQSHSNYVADPVTEMCNQAEKAVVHDLEISTSRARSVGSPLPLDAITGFETGCHLSGESNVVLLIGWKTVHPIALPSVNEMFDWAEVLERMLIDSSYHVTLCRVGSASDNTSAGSSILGNSTITTSNFNTLGSSSGSNLQSGSTVTGATVINPASTLVVASGSTGGSNSSVQSSNSRLQVGLQASLHVQQWRLCLIGEPSAGCQFIAQWRLDALESAYTMESGSNAQNAFSGMTFDSGQNFLGCTPPGSQSGISGSASGVAPYDDRFFLVANCAAGKGLIGNYVFQVDGRRLTQLAHAINELMLRRFPALTAPPGTRVLPSITSTTEDSNTDSLHLRKSAAIDIRRGSSKTAGHFFGQMASSSSLSPPDTCGGPVFCGSASPQGIPGSAATAFAPSSLPTGGGHVVLGHGSGLDELQQQNTPQLHSFSASLSSRSKKSSHHRQLFGAQTLGRSDAIKIPTRRITSALSKMAGDGFGSSRGRSSSKTGSADGSAEGGSSSDASSQAKAQPSLYFPSVMVGAGIITSLVPAPPPQTQSSVRSSDGIFGQAGLTNVPPPKSKVKSEQLPPTPLQTSAPTSPPPPPPPPLSSLVCDRCKRRSQRRGGGNGHQKTPSSISSEECPGVGSTSGGVFAADEDTDQPSASPPPVQRERIPPSLPEFYSLYKLLYQTVKPFHKTQRPSRSGSLDICAFRRRKLIRERVFEALGGGEGSALDRLLLRVAPLRPLSKPCVFLLVFSPDNKSCSLDETDYRWYLVHRPGNCCLRCCLWNTPVLLSELNLQDVVANQNKILASDEKKWSGADLERELPCGGVPCLSTARFFVWSFSEKSQCTYHPKTGLSRPWSVLYLGPDSEIDDDESPISNSTSSFCCYCGSPLNRPRRSRISQSTKSTAPAEFKSSHHHQQHQLENHHTYANLIRGGNGSSTLPSVSRRGHHHQTAPVVFPGGKLVPSAARDVPDSGNRRGAFYTSSNSCSTSQASSPSSPQPHASYCNLSVGTGSTCLPPNPLKYPHVLHEERGAYANLQHLSSFHPTTSSFHQQQARWRGSTRSGNLVPDEIREPRRNYALVDLRPSPASSVISPGDTITLVSTSEDAISTKSESTTSGLIGNSGNKTDSSASTLHTNTSTSSSAATIVPVGGNRPRTASNHRRTSSHSLTAVLPVPTLNYVHIMTKKDATATAAAASANASSSVGCESPASSASTASSSEKEQRAPIASCPNASSSSVAEEQQVPYAKIDFERTRALNAVNGTTGSSETGQYHLHYQKGLGGQSLVSKNASLVGMGGGLRGLNMRKKSDGW